MHKTFEIFSSNFESNWPVLEKQKKKNNKIKIIIADNFFPEFVKWFFNFSFLFFDPAARKLSFSNLGLPDCRTLGHPAVFHLPV